jgi:hypothetical protein
MLKDKPKDWREGQTIMNFLQSLFAEFGNMSSDRYADIFHVPDEKLGKLYEEFLKAHESK